MISPSLRRRPPADAPARTRPCLTRRGSPHDGPRAAQGGFLMAMPGFPDQQSTNVHRGPERPATDTVDPKRLNAVKAVVPHTAVAGDIRTAQRRRWFCHRHTALLTAGRTTG
ncbi:hypothetical protein GCM10010377_74620 [Streptomyces viridiviolaceus]|nr:hypothetical protein GCM10010377_74620 [Streptomyces viridiviolaceus]